MDNPLQTVLDARFPEGNLGRMLPHARALRALLGQGDADFLLRFAVVEELGRNPRTRWTREDLGALLGWLDDEQRDRTLAGLRRGGWIEKVAHSEIRLSERGAALLTALSELFGALPGDEADMALGVLRLEWAGGGGVEPGPLMRHLLHQVHRILDDGERALESRSEAAILRAGRRVRHNLGWAVRAREALEGMQLGGGAELEAARTLGRGLARLHGATGRLQRALTELGRQRIPMGESGLSMADLAAWVGAAPIDLLADLGDLHVHEPVRPWVAIVDNLLTEAEFQLCSAGFEEDDAPARGWEAAADGPQEQAGSAEMRAPPELDPLTRLSEDLLEWAGRAPAIPLVRALHASRFAEAAHRLAMLALAEEGTFPFDPEVLGPGLQVPAVRMTVEGLGDEPEPAYHPWIKASSRGVVEVISPPEGGAPATR